MKITFRRTNEVETSFEVLLEQSEEQKLKVLCLHVSPHVFSRFIIIRCTFSLTFFFLSFSYKRIRYGISNISMF